MAGIEKRIAKDGTLSYRITLTEGLDASGKKVRHRMTYKPEPGMSAKQADKAAQKAAFQFEQQFEQGYSVDHDQRFSDYASYVLELKLNTGLKRSTYERYLTMMPRINSQIGGLYLKAIRPMHLNQLYAYLSKPGLREGNLKAVAIISVEPILKKKHLSRQQLAKDAGVSPMTITSFCRKAPIMKECAEKIAEALGRKYSDLFRTEHDMTPLSAKTILPFCIHGILVFMRLQPRPGTGAMFRCRMRLCLCFVNTALPRKKSASSVATNGKTMIISFGRKMESPCIRTVLRDGFGRSPSGTAFRTSIRMRFGIPQLL